LVCVPEPVQLRPSNSQSIPFVSWKSRRISPASTLKEPTPHSPRFQTKPSLSEIAAWCGSPVTGFLKDAPLASTTPGKRTDVSIDLGPTLRSALTTPATE